MHKEVYAFFPSFTSYVEELWDNESFVFTHALFSILGLVINLMSGIKPCSFLGTHSTVWKTVSDPVSTFLPPLSGLAFNVGNPNTDSSAVTDPHVDSKDDPNGTFGVYCWGRWNWRKGRGALIIPEAKIQVNLRPGDTIYFYSSRLVHYNRE